MSSRPINTEELLHRNLPSDKIKINTTVVYIASCYLFTVREVMSSDSSVNDYCRLCAISLLKVKFGSNLGKQGHSSSENQFRPSKRKECFGIVSAEIVKKLDCRLFIPCSILIGSVIHVAEKFVTWASYTSSLKLQLHPRQVPWLRAANVFLTRRTKPAQHGENQNPPVSIRGQQSHAPSIEGSTSATKGKSRKSLYFPLLEKTEEPKSLRDLSEISRGRGGGNFKFGFGNEVTNPCNGSEIY